MLKIPTILRLIELCTFGNKTHINRSWKTLKIFAVINQKHEENSLKL